MNTDTIKSIAGIIVLLAAQVLVLNNIHLFGCATPLLLVYIIIIMPADTPRWLSLVLGFTLGIVSDIFSNTPGVATTSLTLSAFLQPYLLKLFISREAPESLSPSMTSLGNVKFMFFSFTQVLLYCVLFFSLQGFTFFHIGQWALFAAGSTVLTYVLLLTIETTRRG